MFTQDENSNITIASNSSSDNLTIHYHYKTIKQSSVYNYVVFITDMNIFRVFCSASMHTRMHGNMFTIWDFR